MRLALLALAGLAPASLLAAAQDTAQKFAALAAANAGIIKLDSKLFHELTAKDREWSATVQLTALGNAFKCMPCKEFNPSFNAAGKAWSKASPEHRDHHFFATLDFENGQDVFRSLGLNSAPVVYSYSATKGPHASPRAKPEPQQYDFQEGFTVEPLIETLSRSTPVPIPYKKPPPYALIFTSAMGVISFALIAPYAAPFLRSRWTWAAGTLTLIVIFTGGEMFVRIRGVPYAQPQRGGGLQWITPGFSSQLGMEVHVVAAIYSLLSLTVIALQALVPRVPSPARQKAGVFLWSTVMLVTFSGLLALFRVKNGGYPFRLFF